MIKLIKKARNWFLPKIENKDSIAIPKALVQAFGLPFELKGCKNTEFHTLILEIDVNGRELADPFKYLRAYEDLILKSKNPLELLDSPDYERFKLLQKANPHFLQGDSCIKSEKFTDAEKYYSRGLLLYPFHCYARLNLAYIYRAIGRLDLSEQHYLEGIKYAPDQPSLWSNLGRTYLTKEDRVKAEQAFFRSLDLFGGSDDFCISQLEQLGALIRFYKSDREPPVFVTREQYFKIIRDNVLEAATPEQAFQYIQTAIREGYHDLFLEVWALAKNKYFPDKESWIDVTYLFEGFSARMKKNDSLAKSIWESGIVQFPNSAVLHTNLGKLQTGSEAIASFEKAFQLGDSRTDNIVLYYEKLENERGAAYAQEVIKDAFEKYGSFSFINFLAHKMYPRESVEFASFLLEMIERIKDPVERNREYGMIAGIHGEAGRYKEALLILQKLVHSECREIGIHWNYLLCLKHLGLIDKMNGYLEGLRAQEWLTEYDRVFLKDRLHTLIEGASKISS